MEAQRNAIRALCYTNRLPAYVIAENQIGRLGSPKLVILPSPQALGETAWNELLKYVEAGGTLVVTGPVDRDEHWQVTNRTAALGLKAQSKPVTYHNAEIRAGDRNILLSFGLQAQNWLDSLHFEDGATLKEISHSKGRIFWAAFPVELADDLRSSSDLYSYVASRIGIVPPFTSNSAIPAGTLIFPSELADSMMYVMVSDSAENAAINIRDTNTGVTLALSLPHEHAAIALIDKKQKRIIARYGF